MILEEAAKLLELKQLDADWAMIFGAKLIKVRWQFTDAEGQEVRLQLPFPGRTSLSFAEVRKVRPQSTRVRVCVCLLMCAYVVGDRGVHEGQVHFGWHREGGAQDREGRCRQAHVARDRKRRTLSAV